MRSRSGARDVCFAGSRVRVEFSGPGAADLVDFLFREIPDEGGPEPHITVRVEGTSDGGLSFVEGDSAGHQDQGAARDLASLLQDRVAFHLSDKSQGGLVFHAAAVSWCHRCVLLPGPSGAGKTTLTAWLVRKGFTYLTDELVFVPLGRVAVEPLTRPLNVKTAGRMPLAGTIIDFDAAANILIGNRVTLASATALGDTAVDRVSDLAAVVFPRYEPGVQMQVDRLSKASTAMDLMSGLINARNLPAHGFSDVSRLARDVPGWRLSYSAFDQIEPWVNELKRTLTDQSR